MTVTQWVSYQGQRGARAESKTATVLSTGEPKYVLYVEGTGFQMGYLVGLLAPKETNMMCEDYLEHIVPELIVPEWDHKLANDTIYHAVIDLLRDFLMNGSNESFDKYYPLGVFPEELVQEMKGLVAGVQASSSPSSSVNLRSLVTLNYGMDFLMANVLHGKLPFLLSTHLQQWKGTESETVRTQLHTLLTENEEEARSVFHVPAYCDAWAARGAATKGGQSAFFSRDFQLPTANVFQNIQSMIIYNPADGRKASVSSGAPGFIGSVTIMNVDGVCSAEDTLRSGDADSELPGLCLFLCPCCTYENEREKRKGEK